MLIVQKRSRAKNLLIVGGAGRNVGKTEFVCRLIAAFSARYEIYALKVSAIFPDEQLYHGDHSQDSPARALFEEKRFDTSKDTSRMLRAGAKKVFYLRGDDEGIEAGYWEFLQKIPGDALVVCESNSLRSVVEPAIHIVVRSVSGEVKPRAQTQLVQADMVVCSDGATGFAELARIEVAAGNRWKMRS